MGRRELLEMLIAQEKENARLRAELGVLEEDADSRTMQMLEAGSLAQASLSLSGIFEAADAAAKQYLDTIERLKADTEAECAERIAEAKAEAEAILAAARCDAEAPAAKLPEEPRESADAPADDDDAVSRILREFYENK